MLSEPHCATSFIRWTVRVAQHFMKWLESCLEDDFPDLWANFRSILAFPSCFSKILADVSMMKSPPPLLCLSCRACATHKLLPRQPGWLQKILFKDSLRAIKINHCRCKIYERREFLSGKFILQNVESSLEAVKMFFIDTERIQSVCSNKFSDPLCELKGFWERNLIEAVGSVFSRN